ncbi:MAG: hypothetical protein IKS48_09960 [Eubacterium sp.]|nr:hypothetical protein [Eubacterium sp.]
MDTGLNVRKRLTELAEKAYRENRYIFTDFLNISQLSAYHEMKKEFIQTGSSLFGGCPECERCVVRFGSEDTLGYDQPFPIAVLKIAPVNPKFAEKLTHRDYLGSIIGLGLEREKIGDIIIKESEDKRIGQIAFIFVIDSISDYIIENLGYVKHTHVSVTVSETFPDEARPHLEEESIIVSSNRLDAIISRIYKFSRDGALKHITEGKVFVNGITRTENAKPLKDGDIVSVRGKGKFIMSGVGGTTKKDKIYINIQKYI